MNYFTHAVRYLDRPHFMAGLAVPDWLSVVDRKSRVRRRLLEELLPELDGPEQELMLGVRQHLDDDQWFHGTAAFYEMTGAIGRSFRVVFQDEESWQYGFLGHLVLELLLDATLIENEPEALLRYYHELSTVDPDWVEQSVGRVTTRPPVRLGEFIGLYLRERFLEDYLDDDRLLRRLNQVMHRVSLKPLPAVAVEALGLCRPLVRAKVNDLLPDARFTLAENQTDPRIPSGH